MLSLGKLAAGSGDYYTAMVATGAEEYYAGAREAPGTWTGRSADLLGLDGEVTAQNSRRCSSIEIPVQGSV